MEGAIWPLGVYGGVIVALVAVLLAFSAVLGERHRNRPAADEPFESGVVPVGDSRLRFSAKFHLTAVFFVIFDLESVFVYAWAIAIREAGWAGYVGMAVFIAVLLVALAWLWRLGALDWGPRRRHVPAPRSG